MLLRALEPSNSSSGGCCDDKVQLGIVGKLLRKHLSLLMHHIVIVHAKKFIYLSSFSK